MNEQEKLEFFNELTELLKGEVKPKSEEVLNQEAFCDILKAKITKIIEEIHKLDLLNNDFKLSEFISQNVNFPIERLKEQYEKTWLSDKLTIGLMGHFSTGKTTALNLLFGEAFQIGKGENTALTTYLTYGYKTSTITLVDKCEQSQEIPIEKSGVFDYSKGIKDFPFARIFNYMVKENNNSLLRELTFIDTPGLFSTNTGHSTPTIDATSKCDIIFWFLKLTNELSARDVEILRNIGDTPLYIIFSYYGDYYSTKTSQEAVEAIIQKRTILICK